MMKLFILCALLALAAAAVEDFEPISADPAFVDFDPESDRYLEIDLEVIRELLQRLRDYLEALPPKIWPDWNPPSEIPELAAIKDRIVQLVQNLWPGGLPRPPKPTPVDIEDALNWAQTILTQIINSGIPLPPRPSPGAGEAVRDWWNNLPPLPNPVTAEGLRDWLRNAIATFPPPIIPRPPVILDAQIAENDFAEQYEPEPVNVVDSLNY